MFSLGAALFLVKVIIKGLEIYIGCVKVWLDHVKGLRGHVSVRDKNIKEPFFVCQLSRIMCKFEKYRWLCIRVCNTPTASSRRSRDDIFRRIEITDDHPLSVCGELRNIGVLTKTALEIAPNGGNGIGECARQDMIEGLLFNGINVLSNQPSINKSLQDPMLVFTNPADTPLAIFDDTPVITELASNLPVVQSFIQIGLHGC
jgi:hypothetical protein